VVEPIKCIEMQHFNLAARDFEASMDHFQHVWGAQFVHDMPGNGWHAVLLYLGGVLFEMFVPHQFLLNGRYGPHWVGIEYQIGDLRVTRDALGDRGVDLIRDVGIAIHTDPSQCFGVAFEFYDHSFFAEPFDWLEPLRPPEYWEQEHPLGLMGLKRYSVAVADLDAALGFYRDMFDVEVLYQDERPSVGLRATGVRLANTIVELQAPTGRPPPGPLRGWTAVGGVQGQRPRPRGSPLRRPRHHPGTRRPAREPGCSPGTQPRDNDGSC
jgi:predicted enzyme related to lactoylglutathione lyase